MTELEENFNQLEQSVKQIIFTKDAIIKEQAALIEKLKCCGNCKNREGYTLCKVKDCNFLHNKWELK